MDYPFERSVAERLVHEVQDACGQAMSGSLRACSLGSVLGEVLHRRGGIDWGRAGAWFGVNADTSQPPHDFQRLC